MAFNFCDRCGFKLTPNAKFCANCGAPVASEQNVEESQVSADHVQTAAPPIGVLASSAGHKEADTQKIEEADTALPIEFTICGHVLKFDRSVKDYVDLYNSFSNLGKLRAKKFVEYYKANVHSLDDLFQNGLSRYMEETAALFKQTELILESYGLAFSAEELLSIAMEHFDIGSTFSLYQEIAQSLENYAFRLASYRAANRSNQYTWGSFGFGLSGAVKGVLTTAALNAGTNFVRGLSHSIVDASDRAKFEKIKKKMYREADFCGHLSGDILILAERLFTLSYVILVTRKILTFVDIEKNKDVSKNNGLRSYEVAKKSIELRELPQEADMNTLLNYACWSIEQDPRTMEGYLALYLATDEKATVLSLCDYFGLRPEFLMFKDQKISEMIDTIEALPISASEDYQSKAAQLSFLLQIDPDDTASTYSRIHDLISQLNVEQKEFEDQREKARQAAIRAAAEEAKRKEELRKAQEKAKLWDDKLEKDKVEAEKICELVVGYEDRREWASIWNLAKNGCSFAEYVLAEHYLDLADDAIEKVNVARLNQIADGIREYAKQNILFAKFLISFLYMEFWVDGYEDSSKAEEMLLYCAQTANDGCISALAFFGHIGLDSDNPELSRKIKARLSKTPKECLKIAAEQKHPDAMWEYGVDIGNQAGNDLEKKAMSNYYTSLAKCYGYVPPEPEKKEKESSGCFITSAVCRTLKKPDNCYELTAFRTFRDTWLRKQPGGKALIKEYYQIAPPIVSAIDSRLDNASIYRSIWEKYLIPCLRYLESGQYEKCKMCYVTMVETLKSQYQ